MGLDDYSPRSGVPLPPHVELTHGTADELGAVRWLFHDTAPNVPPTYNHTRGDSLRTPCPVCRERNRRGL